MSTFTIMHNTSSSIPSVLKLSTTRSVLWCLLTVGCLTNVTSAADEAPERAKTSDKILMFDESTGTSSDKGNMPDSSVKFPRIGDRRVRSIQLDAPMPVGLSERPYALLFTVSKLLLIVLAVLIWFRTLQLSAQKTDGGQSEADAWTSKLFVIGLFGILIALLLPAWIPGSCLLIMATLVPFSRFKRWHNRQPEAAKSPPLKWKHLFRTPKRAYTGDRVAAIKLPSGKQIGTTNSNIRLIPKSRTGTDNAARSRGTQNSPGHQTVLALIDEAVAQRASDLHVNTKDGEVIIRQRVDGTLSTLTTLPSDLGNSVINIFKVMSDLNIADRRRSQDGSFRADVNGRWLNFRVSSQGTQTGEKLSIRILDPAKQFATLSALGMPEETQKRLTASLNRSNGLIVIVGGTGAGKSTTAYASLQTIDSEDRNILSIEDPIEYQIPSVDQIEVNNRAGQTVESALRSVLRQDADVIFIGEIRDTETAKIACQAAMTGQLVVATMHANDAVCGTNRLTELGVDLHNAANALRAVLSQKLVRKLCVDCRAPYTPTPEERARLGIQDFEGVLHESPEVTGNTCATCNGRGFISRTAVFELLEVNSAIRDLILENCSASKIKIAAENNGMTPLVNEGRQLLRDGVISMGEFERVFE